MEECDLYQRKQMPGLLVEKGQVKGYEISAITLRPSCHLVVTGLMKAIQDRGIAAEISKNGDDNEEEKVSSRMTKLLDGYAGATGVNHSTR